MDTSALRTLNALTPLRSHFQSRTFGFGSSSSSPQILRSNLHSPLASSSSSSSSFHRLSPLCSLSENVNGNALPPGVGEAVAEFSKKILHVVLVSPQIPGNTGSIARTCAASAVGLHLVGPLGFPVDDTKLKRAGLDYWPFVIIKVHGSWTEFRDYFEKQEGDKRLLAFTKRGTTIHSEFSYRKGDYLVFGSETKGLPPEALVDCKSNSFGGGTIRIPMVDTYVRCLNLSVSVGISVYEASRQLNYEQLQNPSESSIDRERCFNTEDIFA